MEEKTTSRVIRTHQRRLLPFISHHCTQEEAEQARIVAKMNQCFSHHHTHKQKTRPPLRPLHHLNASHHLRKNRNKVQQNIKLHQDAFLKCTISRSRDKPKKTQLIVNRPYYQQYFTPKTSEEILSRHREHSKNDHFQHPNKHHSTFTSLHYNKEDISDICAQTTYPKQLKKKESKLSLKKQMSSDSFKETKMLLDSLRGTKKPNKDITVYSRQELEAYYQSLSKFSRGNPQKYKEGLQTMLGLMSISCNDKILSQEFLKFQLNPTLQQFMVIYNKIVDAALRQNVMDFFDIIFEECGIRDFTKEELYQLLSQRMRPDQALQIADEIFFLVGPDTKKVETGNILTLCCTNDEFCWFMRQFSILETRKKEPQK